MKDSHSDKVFYLVAGLSGIIMIYVILVTFLKVPQESLRFVDSTLSYLLGVLTTSVGYFTGGNPAKRVPDAGNTTAEISATITKTPDEE